MGVGTTKSRLPSGALVAAMRTARPDVTQHEMCYMLEEMREPTPRGCQQALVVLSTT